MIDFEELKNLYGFEDYRIYDTYIEIVKYDYPTNGMNVILHKEPPISDITWCLITNNVITQGLQKDIRASKYFDVPGVLTMGQDIDFKISNSQIFADIGTIPGTELEAPFWKIKHESDCYLN
nr:MAG TPA: hypothetical protein [Bacteriophage sp.]